jgi:Ca2+-binding EF-hand superfamily protein
MTTELQIRKLDRAFDQLDVSNNGQLERDDLVGLGSRMILGFGQSPTSAKGKEVLDGFETFWNRLAADANIDRDDALSPAEFRDAMISAYIKGDAFDVSFRPVAQAVARLTDTDNDGHLAAAEFRTMQVAFGTSSPDIETAFAALDRSGKGLISVETLVEAAREYYTSPDPQARGNLLFGPL